MTKDDANRIATRLRERRREILAQPRLLLGLLEPPIDAVWAYARGLTEAIDEVLGRPDKSWSRFLEGSQGLRSKTEYRILHDSHHTHEAQISYLKGLHEAYDRWCLDENKWTICVVCDATSPGHIDRPHCGTHAAHIVGDPFGEHHVVPRGSPPSCSHEPGTDERTCRACSKPDKPTATTDDATCPCGAKKVQTALYGQLCKKCDASMFEPCMKCRTPRAHCCC